ncbi:CRISPR-associated protein, Csy4 family [Izhakiella capsodis]|uniref:CRISPR-associated protein, Csy4 family n=1 Tax=Izhakiella capsodis TaxID=1367852 RepID=A0A1I4WUI6_9GAMM|nr:type I-F CRISPR-associated endoribonuclease Cas6/Csy4 [Izhakiella capsodis]SFN17147.1 CRISPR-associated protein, Csy4 family [Izhakiella capsodis]
MDHYIDVTLLAYAELSEETLMATLFTRLHLALVSHGSENIGVSFPLHDIKPGNLLRVHGAHSALQQLEKSGWRNGLNDYCQDSGILPVPAGAQWRTVNRVQVKSNPARLYRRSVRKGWLTQEQAEERLNAVSAQQCQLPYLSIKSRSGGQYFRLFIQHGELAEYPVAGRFNSYGLSQQATVPWF